MKKTKILKDIEVKTNVIISNLHKWADHSLSMVITFNNNGKILSKNVNVSRGNTVEDCINLSKISNDDK